MSWIVRKTTKDESTGFLYHHGANVWGNWGNRSKYTSQAKAKADPDILPVWEDANLDVVAIKE
tara:strand:- start:200 stop:388 length:189 start_codon:yes stop_codon:yes gene_type:complete